MAQFLAPIVNFAVVLFILIYFGRKPFFQLFADRNAHFGKEIGEAEGEARTAFAELETWQKRKAGSAQEAAQMMVDAKARMQAISTQTLAQANAQAERIVSEAQMVGKTEASKGRQRLQAEVVRRSLGMAQEFLSAHVGEKDRQKLLGEYLELVRNESV